MRDGSSKNSHKEHKDHKENARLLLLSLWSLCSLWPRLLFSASLRAFVLIGAAGWTTRLLPRLLCVFYLLAWGASLLVYALPELEGVAIAFGVVVSLWQGFVLWKTAPGIIPPSEISDQGH